MEFRILGPLELADCGHPLPLGRGKQKALLALLLLHANKVVSAERLIDELWGESPPATVDNALQNYVSRLRKRLGGERLLTRSPGYLLRVEPGELDLARFEALLAQARAADEPEPAAAALSQALALWRGSALADFTFEPFAQSEIVRLEDLRLAALEERIEAELALGRDIELVGELEALVAEHPLRERFRAQLMLALYRAGRQADALTAYQSARETLVEEIGIEPNEELRDLQRRILEQDASLALPRAPARAEPQPLERLHQANLPIPSTPFLGRERELQEVQGLLSQADVRLLTLTGPGGTGKTRLAAQAAGLSSSDYPDGVWWVPLAPLRDPQLVLETAAQALGAKDGLAEHIGARSLLVLFDNFEQVVDAAADVAGLLASCPKLDLLVTSREALHVTGEQEYPVPPFVHEEGVGFFVARARAVKPSFIPDEAVSEICRRLDSLPLALELAAARVKALSSGQILERLEQRLPLLTGGARDLPERQRTLRAAIEWSHELLSPEEQRLFARLSVFRGGCTLEAAEEVSGADLDTLQSLVDKSLLRHSEERYWMLETIREYAFARLEMADEAAELRAKHAQLFCALAERAKPELRGETLGGWLVRLAAEYPNLRAALEWGQEAGGDIVPRLAASLWRFWHIRGYFREGRFWTLTALAQLGSEPSTLRAELLSFASAFDLRAGEPNSALRLARESLAVAQAVGAVERMAEAWADVASAQVELDDREAGREAFEHALQLKRDLGDERGILVELGNLGNLAMTNEEYAEASRLFRECLQLAEKIADDSDIAWAASNLGLMLVQTGQLAAAKEPLRRSLRLMRQLAWSEGSVYSLIGVAAACANEAPMRSTALAAAAEVLRHELGLSLQVVEKRLSEHTVATVRSQMGTDAFQSAWAEGQRMALDDAVEYALCSID